MIRGLLHLFVHEASFGTLEYTVLLQRYIRYMCLSPDVQNSSGLFERESQIKSTQVMDRGVVEENGVLHASFMNGGALPKAKWRSLTLRTRESLHADLTWR
jgi:hypothetical protein